MLESLRERWRFRRAVAAATRIAASPPSPGARDLIVLPCWRRPEFLWHCLDNLTRAPGFEQLRILFRPDTGYSPENLEVIHEFAERLPPFEIDFPPRSPFRRTKQSSNLLLGYLKAAALTRRFVFMIEDDLIVARDYFRWHWATHADAGDLFCSIAALNSNRRVEVPSDPGGYYLSSGDYCPYGVAFDARVVLEELLPHVNLAYLRRPKRYVRSHFPESRIPLGYVEQDGLLRRIQERSRRKIAYACVPRAFHAGFYGYNRPGGLTGPWRERVAALREIIYSPQAMHDAAVRPEWVDVPVDLAPAPWSAQRRVRDSGAGS